ncbi:hypothetical protein [Mucilaginibacter sp. FT3.2]|uniref:hypothetical protein n=1 Tax=Mucilaginibacter sp. FT3.2 TaxID=2723090 RepID=UPI001616588B|nr:hypothetical protein [Mucilaginibacter sp. FT3.2]MBB6232945.1 hypothetical protein [Mucilaginibacter sp. FT3.2]
MRTIKLLSIIVLITVQQSYAQQSAENKKELKNIINAYGKSVLERDSSAFYNLFNDGPVTWCAALRDRSQAKEVEKKGVKAAGSNYFSGS